MLCSRQAGSSRAGIYTSTGISPARPDEGGAGRQVQPGQMREGPAGRQAGLVVGRKEARQGGGGGEDGQAGKPDVEQSLP